MILYFQKLFIAIIGNQFFNIIDCIALIVDLANLVWLQFLQENRSMQTDNFDKMIERLQKISAQLFKNALKTYNRNDVLTHKRAHSNNLSEILLLYPNAGTNFLVHKRSWPSGLHYEIARSTHKSNRNGVFYGLKKAANSKGEQIACHTRPVRLHGLSKRGIWAYQFGNFSKCKTDNGLIYNRADFQAFAKVSGLGISKTTSVNRSNEQEGQLQEEQSV